MPIYEYECTKRHRFELRQDFHAEPKATCPTCNATARRLILPVPVHYKGSGFYTTDYARGKAPGEESTNGSKKDSPKDAAKATASTASKDGTGQEED